MFFYLKYFTKVHLKNDKSFYKSSKKKINSYISIPAYPIQNHHTKKPIPILFFSFFEAHRLVHSSTIFPLFATSPRRGGIGLSATIGDSFHRLSLYLAFLFPVKNQMTIHNHTPTLHSSRPFKKCVKND